MHISTNFEHHVEHHSKKLSAGFFDRKNVYVVVGSKKIERVLELEFREEYNISENLLSRLEKEMKDWYKKKMLKKIMDDGRY